MVVEGPCNSKRQASRARPDMTAASNIVEWTTLGRCIKNQYKLDCRTLIKWAEGNDCGGGGGQGGPLLLVYSLVG